MRRTINRFVCIGLTAIALVSCKKTNTYNGHEYVDLGLSVKWATCNVGAQKPEDYGNYYAWGEIRPKNIYTWKGYRFRASGDARTGIKFSKYDPDEIVDNLKKTVLEMADDVANVEWGGDWRMPTREEVEELTLNCDWVWTTQNGVNGVRITSKVEGYTDRSIFIPAAGYKDDSKQMQTGKIGYIWSSTNTNYYTQAYNMFFNSHGSDLDSRIWDYINEDWYWNDTEGDDNFGGLPQSLADKLRKYFASGKVNLDSIPPAIYSEYRTYIISTATSIIGFQERFLGLPVRPVFP